MGHRVRTAGQSLREVLSGAMMGVGQGGQVRRPLAHDSEAVGLRRVEECLDGAQAAAAPIDPLHADEAAIQLLTKGALGLFDDFLSGEAVHACPASTVCAGADCQVVARVADSGPTRAARSTRHGILSG